MGEAETHLAVQGQVDLTETRRTWRKFERFGRDDEADDPLGRDGRDPGNLADGRPIPGELGRQPTPITVNAQTNINEVNPSLRIR